EPDSFSWGSTIVAVTQVGRFTDGGSSDIGFGASKNSGATWTHGTLPGITTYRGGPHTRVSDPSVAYDAKHKVWLVSSLAIDGSGNLVTSPEVVVNRSADGVHWNKPVVGATGSLDMDKNWIACDNWPHSPHYGNCYIEWDDSDQNDIVEMATST